MKKNTSVKSLLGVLALAAVLLAGCAGGQLPNTGSTQPAGEAEATAALPDTGGTAPAGNRVQVGLREYVIEMPVTLPAGHTIFEITNTGTEEHSFDIEGQGLEAGLEQDLQPGESMTLEVDLAEGVYDVHCPVSDHEEEGMHLDLTVTAP